MSINETDEAMLAIGAWHLGKTSAQHESGGRNSEAISTGRGDHGGVSYGAYQLSSKTGTLLEYLKQSRYKNNFDGLAIASLEFNAKWVDLAKMDPGFGRDQHEFIKRTHYDVQNKALLASGLDLSDRGRAVQDALWSTSVQFRHKTKSIFISGIEEKFGKSFDLSTISDKDIVEAVQDYKITHNNSLFRSSPGVWRGLLRRASEEKTELVQLSEHERLLALQGLLPDWRLSIDAPNTDIPFLGIPNALPGVRPLQLGNRGFDVARLQQNLNHLGITMADGSTIVANGEFDTRTHEAVQGFQRSCGLPATGFADNETLAAVQVGVRAIESAWAISKFGQEFQPQGHRTDWLDRDSQGLPNYLRASSLPDPSTVEHAAAERSSAHPPVSARIPPHRSGPAHTPLHQTAPPSAPVPSTLPPLPTTQTLEPGDRSAAVQALQQHLQLLGATDRYGQKIQADRDYGDRTREAVEQFQLWTGREPTGIADAETLRAVQVQAQFTLRQRAQGISISPDAHLAERLRPAMPNSADAALERPVPGRSPLMPSSDPSHSQLPKRVDYEQPKAASDRPHLDTQALSTHHRDHPLFEAIRRQLPPGTSDEMAAHVMLQAKLGGVEHVGKLDEVIVQGGRAYVAGKTPGDMAAVDLSAPVPAMQETLRQSATFDTQQAVQLAQFREQQRAIGMPGGGPTMG